MQLDKLHGGVTCTRVEFYCHQVILDPNFRILNSIVLVWLAWQLKFLGYSGLPDVIGEAVETEGFVLLIPKSALISGAIYSPLGDIVARFMDWGVVAWAAVTSRSLTSLR